MNVLFYVQSLLGIGHLKRAAVLARALHTAGLEVHVLLGNEVGPLVDFGGAHLIALPTIRSADAEFSGLADDSGQPLSEDFKANRRQLLLDALHGLRPDLLLIESYPFGRRQLRFELEPLLEAAWAMQPRPLVVGSIRDVLQQRSAQRNDETLAVFERYFDHLLVHGDPAFLPLALSFPEHRLPAARVHYTGYVREAAEASDDPMAAGEVLVSAGGGAVGERLLAAAVAARPLTRLADRRWRLLCGPNLPAAVRARLQHEAPDGVIVEDLRADFAARLGRAALSVSQAGYNTVLDLFGTRCPAVLVPFHGGAAGQTEQTLRARALEQQGRVVVLDEHSLAAAPLAAAIDRALAAPWSEPAIRLDGAQRSANLLRDWIREHQHE